MSTGNPFEPDWTLAPAVTLREWMKESGVSERLMAFVAGGRERSGECLALISEIMDRKPLTEVHARILERGTRIPASFWLNYEHNYRTALARGAKDCSEEG